MYLCLFYIPDIGNSVFKQFPHSPLSSQDPFSLPPSLSSSASFLPSSPPPLCFSALPPLFADQSTYAFPVK